MRKEEGSGAESRGGAHSGQRKHDNIFEHPSSRASKVRDLSQYRSAPGKDLRSQLQFPHLHDENYSPLLPGPAGRAGQDAYQRCLADC